MAVEYLVLVSWLAYLISLCVWGLIVGAFARLALPGRDPMSLLQTMLVGIAGSLFTGVIVYFVTDQRYYGAGWLASLVCATLIVYLIRRSRGGGLMDPGRRRT
jgi:uncharacterized membrane protein YeaQ/YmgE (transglycosylase-associated protein family)